MKSYIVIAFILAACQSRQPNRGPAAPACPDSLFEILSDTLKKTESVSWSDVSFCGRYWGRYQIDSVNLRKLGYRYSKREFLADSNLQNLYLRVIIAAGYMEGFRTSKEIIDYHHGGTYYAKIRRGR